MAIRFVLTDPSPNEKTSNHCTYRTTDGDFRYVPFPSNVRNDRHGKDFQEQCEVIADHEEPERENRPCKKGAKSPAGTGMILDDIDNKASNGQGTDDTNGKFSYHVDTYS
jgi:hypothetical protein